MYHSPALSTIREVERVPSPRETPFVSIAPPICFVWTAFSSSCLATFRQSAEKTELHFGMTHKPPTEFDVVIVGAGIAGSVAAWVLQDSGLSVAVLDEHPQAFPAFRAERISQGAAATLSELKLFDRLERIALPLRSTATIKGGAIEEIVRNTDYSIPLWKLVAELRAGMNGTNSPQLIIGHVEGAETTATRQLVRLRSGQSLACKLLVVATGNANCLLKAFGIEREILSQNHSTTFGFDVEPSASFRLPTDSISVRMCKDGADYMNVFPTTDGGFRANLFTYWPAGGERVRDFIKGDTNRILKRLAPHMMKPTGEWKATGKIECGSVSVMKSTGYRQAGFVLIGDAYGRICPCGGMGVNKALSDILTLRKYVPGWLTSETPLNWEMLSQYYADPTREAFENYLFNTSMFIRNRLLNKHPLWMLRRWYYHQVPVQAKSLVRKLRGQNVSACSGSLAT